MSAVSSGGRSFLILSVAAGLVFLTLIQFGNWQMRRLAWKENLIVQVETRVTQPPVDLPDPRTWTLLQPEEYEYIPVRVRGRFLHDKERHVYTVLSAPKGRYGGMGYFVLTPLVLEQGGTVLINRGFVPLSAKEPAARPGSQPEGEAIVTGLLRAPEPRGWFTPQNDPGRNIWFARNPAEMQAALGVSDLAPFTLDETAGEPGRLPQAGETRVTFSNRHREYAYTWYALALSLALVYGGAAWGRARRRRST